MATRIAFLPIPLPGDAVTLKRSPFLPLFAPLPDFAGGRRSYRSRKRYATPAASRASRTRSKASRGEAARFIAGRQARKAILKTSWREQSQC